MSADGTARAVEFARAQAAEDELTGAVSRANDTVPPATARALQATENAVRAIEAEFGLLSSTEVAQMLASSSGRSLANRMRARGELVYLRRLNRFAYPTFQFSGDRVKPAIRLFVQLARSAGWTSEDVVLWLCSPTTYLPNGGRPVDFLDDVDRVLSVAAQAWGVEW